MRKEQTGDAFTRITQLLWLLAIISTIASGIIASFIAGHQAKPPALPVPASGPLVITDQQIDQYAPWILAILFFAVIGIGSFVEGVVKSLFFLYHWLRLRRKVKRLLISGTNVESKIS